MTFRVTMQGLWQLKSNSLIRKCSEDRTVCTPVESYCNRIAECPHGSDEASCSCRDWDMYECSIAGTNLCIYKHWIQNSSIQPL